jgi:hypothetical protein
MSPDTANAGPWGRQIVQFLFTYLTARAIGWFAGIRYNPFSEGFDAVRLVVDFGLWLLCWFAVGAALQRVARATQRAGA